MCVCAWFRHFVVTCRHNTLQSGKENDLKKMKGCSLSLCDRYETKSHSLAFFFFFLFNLGSQ